MPRAFPLHVPQVWCCCWSYWSSSAAAAAAAATTRRLVRVCTCSTLISKLSRDSITLWESLNVSNWWCFNLISIFFISSAKKHNFFSLLLCVPEQPRRSKVGIDNMALEPWLFNQVLKAHKAPADSLEAAVKFRSFAHGTDDCSLALFALASENQMRCCYRSLQRRDFSHAIWTPDPFVL